MNGGTKTGFSTISLERLHCARWDSVGPTERRRRRKKSDRHEGHFACRFTRSFVSTLSVSRLVFVGTKGFRNMQVEMKHVLSLIRVVCPLSIGIWRLSYEADVYAANLLNWEPIGMLLIKFCAGNPCASALPVLRKVWESSCRSQEKYGNNGDCYYRCAYSNLSQQLHKTVLELQ
jgi:hypothetical protein